MRKTSLAIAGILLAIFLASCGGGSGGSTGSPTLSPTTATPSPTPIPSIQATSVPLSVTSTTQVNFGAVAEGGATAITSALVTLPKASAASTATVALSAETPSGVPTPSVRTLSLRRPLSLGATTTALAYFSISFSKTVAVSTSPAFSLTFPSTLASSNYYVAQYDPTGTIGGGWQVVTGTAAAAGFTLSFNAATYAPPLIFSSGVTYEFAIIESASPIATPQPISASPSSLSFTATGPGLAQTATLMEAGYTGTFTPHTSLCTNIASVTAGDTNASFSITPLNAGTCTMYFTDSNGTAVGIPITVTVTQFVGQ